MSNTRDARAVFQADVVVVGGGLIGLACATGAARLGVHTLIVSSSQEGAASPASAGILAPSIGTTPPPVRALGIAARDMYPEYLESLTLRTGIPVPLDCSGVLEVAFHEREAAIIRASMGMDSEWLDGRTLRGSEPGLAPAQGAAFHPRDGAVDVTALLDALRTDAQRDPHISIIDGRATEIRTEQSAAAIELEDGQLLRAEKVVVAAGAWVTAIRGLRRPIPVVPVRGQMLAFDSPGTRHVLMGPHGYLVQRGSRLLVGSTMEDVGFDARTTAEGALLLRDVASGLWPSLANGPSVAHWAGLRPVTPDLLPIVGPDPEDPRLVYACGHSKNGVLLAPLTGRVVAEMLTRGSASIDVGPYAPDRFSRIDR